MPSERPVPGAHAARGGGFRRRAVPALVASGVVLAAAATTALALTGGPTRATSAAPSSGTPDPPPHSPSTSPSRPTSTPRPTPTTSSRPASHATSVPPTTLAAVAVRNLRATGRSGQARATIRYRASDGHATKVECHVGSATGPACQGGPWAVGVSAGSKRVTVGGLPDGVRTRLYFFQSTEKTRGPASSSAVVSFGPIGTVAVTHTSVNGLKLGFTVQVDPGGKPVHVTVTDTAGHRWTARTGRLAWKGSSSFKEPAWNKTYTLTLTVTDTSGSSRHSVTVATSRHIRWLEAYTVADPVHSGTCATSAVDPTWYGQSSCTGSWVSNGSTVQVTCAVQGSMYLANGKKNGPSSQDWYWYFELTDGTYIHASATQEASADGADGNPLC